MVAKNTAVVAVCLVIGGCSGQPSFPPPFIDWGSESSAALTAPQRRRLLAVSRLEGCVFDSSCDKDDTIRVLSRVLSADSDDTVARRASFTLSLFPNTSFAVRRCIENVPSHRRSIAVMAINPGEARHFEELLVDPDPAVRIAVANRMRLCCKDLIANALKSEDSPKVRLWFRRYVGHSTIATRKARTKEEIAAYEATQYRTAR